MNKLFINLLLVAVVIVGVGCQSLNVSQPSAPVGASLTVPMRADVEVGEKITGKSSVSILFGLLQLGGDTKFADGVSYSAGSQQAGLVPDVFGGPVEATKAAAAYNACAASGADVIIAPRYEIQVESYVVFKTVTVTVTGYKGTLKNIQSVK